MLIFKYARDGTLEIEGLKTIAATCDVATEGVHGAKGFFEAKAKEVRSSLSMTCMCTHLDFLHDPLGLLHTRLQPGPSLRRR